jgi:hypothetical protein
MTTLLIVLACIVLLPVALLVVWLVFFFVCTSIWEVMRFVSGKQ